MEEIPAKVIFALSAEIGVFIGMGVLVYHSIRVIYTATNQHHWAGFKEL